MIQPPAGYGLSYIDWCQQEFGVAAALSDDPNMQGAYRTGDPYLEFARQAHAVPVAATKQTHGLARERYKQNALGVNYGMGERSLASRIGELPIQARHLLELHHEVYSQFWRWTEQCVDHALRLASDGVWLG